MENKMYAKPQYKCAICGTIFDDLRDRINCEAECLMKQEVEEKKAAELKKKEAQETSNAHVTKLINEAYAALTEHIDKYGEYEHENEDEDDMSNMIKFLHYFMF